MNKLDELRAAAPGVVISLGVASLSGKAHRFNVGQGVVFAYKGEWSHWSKRDGLGYGAGVQTPPKYTSFPSAAELVAALPEVFNANMITMAEFDRVVDAWSRECQQLKKEVDRRKAAQSALADENTRLREANAEKIEVPASKVGDKFWDAISGRRGIVLPGPLDSEGRAPVYYGGVDGYDQISARAWIATLSPTEPKKPCDLTWLPAVAATLFLAVSIFMAVS